MKAAKICLIGFGILCFSAAGEAATRVLFDEDEYVVSSVGETFDVRVLIDADDRTAELEPVRGGLFSFGAEVSFDPEKAKVSGPAAITTAAELNHFGFFAGAFAEIDAGAVGGKGNIDQTQDALMPHNGSLLMTVKLTNKASPVDQYPLRLDFFRTLGANEQLFLNGAGDVLDGSIVFGSAIVRVVPEPAALSSIAAGILLLLSRRTRGVAPW